MDVIIAVDAKSTIEVDIASRESPSMVIRTAGGRGEIASRYIICVMSRARWMSYPRKSSCRWGLIIRRWEIALRARDK